MVGILQKPVSAGFHHKAFLTEQVADGGGVVDGFADILFKLQSTVFIDPDFQIHLIAFRLRHLKPDPHGFAEIHLEGLAGGNFVFV